MALIRIALRSENFGFYRRQFSRSFSALPNPIDSLSGSGNDDNQNAKYSESTDDFSERIFGGLSEDTSNSFYRSLDRIEKGRYDMVFPGPGAGSSGLFGQDDETFSSLNDGMEGKLKKQATYFEVDQQEVAADDYSYRADMNLRPRMTYTPEDLDIRKPGAWKPGKRLEFKVTTKEVLANADFRNVRFLANFLTESGMIVKRKKTGISAKAQRKVAREIKIARAFGLMPFTTMGTKPFVVGKTMESLDDDYELDPHDVQADDDDVPDPVEE